MRNTREHIHRREIEPLVEANHGNRIFRRTLAKAADGRELLRVIGRYVYFNSVFGGGVANLAGEIAVRQYLFQDQEEEISAVKDRSVQIAAAIFFAAIDEFGDTSTVSRFTHRALAQATLKGIGQFYGFPSGEIDELVKPSVAIEESITRVKQGYLLNQVVDERKLFRALGFHISSEILADEEFNIMDIVLRKKHPELVEHLKKSRVNIAHSVHPPYAWIQIHTTVEMGHFQFAALSANKAMQYYHGPMKGAEVKGLIFDGFKEFSEVQTFCMNHLLDGSTQVAAPTR